MTPRQADLFDPEGSDRPAFRRGDPPTSREAWLLDVAPTLRKRQAEVLEVVDRAGLLGATSFEVARELGVERDSISSRFVELETRNLLVRTERKRRRPGRETGSRSTVWISKRVADREEDISKEKP